MIQIDFVIYLLAQFHYLFIGKYAFSGLPEAIIYSPV